VTGAGKMGMEQVLSRVVKNIRLGRGLAIQKWSDARRAIAEERGVYGNTLSGEVCSATQQMILFQRTVRET
jgi:hypothetical protein